MLHFVEFKELVENQFNNNIKILKSDGGGECGNHTLQEYLKSHGIIHQSSCP